MMQIIIATSHSFNFNKIMENLMAVRLTTYLKIHEIITENIKRTFDGKKYGCGIFIDLKKAFDTVNHNNILQKLEHYCIHEVSLS